MHSTVRVKDYVFDTVALRDAFETISLHESSHDGSYDDDALYALFDFFCDWGPARETDLNATAAKELDSIASGEREALFTHCCEVLAETLQEQFSRTVKPQDVAKLAALLSEDGPDAGRHDFLLQYLWRYARHLNELDPEENQSWKLRLHRV